MVSLIVYHRIAICATKDMHETSWHGLIEQLPKKQQSVIVGFSKHRLGSRCQSLSDSIGPFRHRCPRSLEEVRHGQSSQGSERGIYRQTIAHHGPC